MSVNINTEYAPDYLRLVLDKLKEIWQIDETAFVHSWKRASQVRSSTQV